MRRLVLAILVITLAVGGAAQEKAAKPAATPKTGGAGLPAGAAAAMKSIDAERMRAHVRFLAHDLLEGRGTGQRGGDLAAEYVATQFALYGLKPAGDNGTYMQKVPLVGVTTLPESTFVLVPERGEVMKLKMSADYVAMDETLNKVAEIDAQVVFAGYGIEAPEYQWNDYQDSDVRGKVLLMLVNEPPSTEEKFFKARALTYYGRWTYKYEQAARKGAVGVILIHKTEMASYGWDVVRNSWSGERSYLRTDAPRLHTASWIQLEVARKAVAAAGLNLDDLMEKAKSRDFRPIPLSLRLRAHIASQVRPVHSSNVVAMLPGSDSKLRAQAVVYTAHYDHLGIRPGVAGDNIYNGAADNATGCGILLELARAFASASQKPRRSVLFAAVTAEEQGLRGSEYLGQKPPIPARDIVLDLNYDDVPPLGDPEETEVVGSERITFYPVVAATAREFGLAIRPDSRPEAGHYYRSDHFSLARVGVPAFSVNEGRKFKGHPAEWGEQQANEYNEKHYHQPSDEYRPEMDFTGNAKMARFGFALGWKAASQPGAIGWHTGDEFEAARKASQAGNP
ncbi:MAG: M28 family peptidase [Terriglobales bacterium]